MKNFVFIIFTILFVVACSTPKNELSTRDVANIHSEFFDYSLIEEFEVDFQKHFRSALNTNKKNLLAKGDKSFGVQLLKHGLGKSFYYMYQFDSELDQAVESCSEKECSPFLESKTYEKLQIYRSINERLKEKLVYFYMRLLDIAHVQDDSLRSVFQVTSKHLNKSNSSHSEAARDARMILLDINQRTEEGLETDYTKDPIEYYTSTVLSEVRAAAETLYYPMAGKYNFKSKQHTNLSRHHQELMSQSFSDAIKSFSKKNKSNDSPLYFELQKELEHKRARDPQGTWRNHTGRSFKSGTWALTYDDGPHATFSSRIMDVLKDKGWHATFFWLAKLARLDQHKAVINKAKGLGMGLASHSYSHANLGKSSSNLNKEIIEAKRVLERSYGMKLNFFRLPYGSGTGSSRVKNVITSQNLEHFFWNVDSLDWQDPSPKSIYNRVVKQMKIQKKGIILFHDIRQRTVDVTKLLARNLASDIPNAKIIKLEDGVGVGVANGGVPRSRSENESFPFEIVITASTLNVRTSPISGSVCGKLPKGSIVQVANRDQNTGWYVIDGRDIPGHSRCGGKVYISDSARFSSKY